MMMSDDKVGGCVKKGQNHDDVILEWSLTKVTIFPNGGKSEISFAICTCPNSPVRPKFLTGFQFEGKNVDQSSKTC